MKVVIQRVSRASVIIDSNVTGQINNGLVVLVGIESADNNNDIDWIANKIINMRIFNDLDGIMNKSIKDVNGELLIISQFTLHASTKKGNRPSYIKAAKPDYSKPLYESFILKMEELLERPVKKGVFGADMKVSLINNGPITIIVDSKNKI